jgi:hypothetical protein
MSIATIAQALADTPLANLLSDSSWLFGTLESIHVIALTLVIGSIALVDLRLIGIGPSRGSAEEVLHRLLPFTLGGFVLAAATGSILIFANPIGYSKNVWFAAKFTLLALAGINALVFHLFFQRRLVNAASLAPRISGAISLSLWVGIVASARWIGYFLVGAMMLPSADCWVGAHAGLPHLSVVGEKSP